MPEILTPFLPTFADRCKAKKLSAFFRTNGVVTSGWRY
jgi:pyruvate-formate lyase-activating enzyme